MKHTEQDVERVAEAIYEHDLTWVNSPTSFKSWDETANKDIYRGRARAALEAMAREPLEDVVHDLHPGTKICHVWPLLEGGYEAEIGVPVRQDRDGWWDHERSRGEGATIDEAIRAAVAAAKGDE